jgi:cytochrome P450
MPVAEDLEAPTTERRLSLIRDGLGNSAKAHEHRLLRAARPALPVLNWLGQFARPLLRVPKLGWITADPRTARALLNDPEHLTLLSEGGVGHLWAQILGDWVYELFDGPGHYDLRTRSREQLWFGAGRHLCLGGPLARAELEAVIELLLGDGRPFEIVSRRYGKRVLIPAYASLVVRKVG